MPRSSRRIERKAGGRAAGEIALLLRVADEVVELGPWRLDVMVAVVDQRREIAPPEVEPRIERLAVDPARDRGFPGGPRVCEWPPDQARRRGEAEQGADRGEDIRQRRRRAHRFPGLTGAGQFEHQRDVEGLPVEKDAVLLLAMIAQPFAMVGEEKDDGAVVEIPGLQLLQEAPRRSRRRARLPRRIGGRSDSYGAPEDRRVNGARRCGENRRPVSPC